MMNILHIHPSMAGGGIESMICGLANAMSELSVKVSVCSIFQPKKEDVFWNKLSKRVEKITMGKVSIGFSLSEIFKIYLLLRRGNYDVVHLHGFFYYHALSVLLLHRKIKFFYTVHSDAVMENSYWDKKIFSFKRFCFKRKWIHPITISNVSQQSFFDFYKCPSKLIFNGVAKPHITEKDIVSSYRNTPNTKVFLHAGRIDRSKNQLVLCKVFSRLIQEGHDVVLLIAGANQDSTIFNSIQSYFNDRIHYLGERSDIPQLFYSCDGMCLPSIWEGLPITLLEAISVGCVPICSPVGGIPDVIKSGYNGVLSNSSSEDDYYQALHEFLLQSDEINVKMKSNCIDSFLQYDIVNTANQYLDYYKEA